MAVSKLRAEDESDPDQPVAKRLRSVPSFASVIREAVVAKSLQNVCFALEPLLRRVVHEEVERGLVHVMQPPLRSPQMCIEEVEPSSCLQLAFARLLSRPIFTGSRIEDKEKNALQILLTDTRTGERSPTLLKIEIVVLDGDFPSGDQEQWTSDEFNGRIVKEREGKRPLLIGEHTVTLRDGMAHIGELMFTDNSSWIRSRKFRLGARVFPGSYDGPRIKEALTESFTVKDHRGESYKKHYPPSLGDKVWRLEKIGKGGAFDRRLAAAGIKTVQEFLKQLVIDPCRLRSILGPGMSDRQWERSINHARTCTIGEQRYMYRRQAYAVIMNPICEVVGIMINDVVSTPQHLSQQQMADFQQLILEAYHHCDKLEKVDGMSFDARTSLQPSVIGSSTWYSNHHESLRSQYPNEGIFELGTTPSTLQLGSNNWIQNTMLDTPDQLHEGY
ncbi:calmodulin-binding protein 60 D-like isoform X2 [Phoenix dactylifera]|uniref:Calmodulin-binding protein 60 D-like isoform X2 n=1 Tax=Phoenix dactylifera TaxID=42345 RepID=A0A8B7CEW9_PHODC|nr:calmodulin-binding protein 60 D-like isoform X2 [Phoenix dactylifera]